MSEQAGTLLWEMRTASRRSLSQVAREAGISKSALSQWETGVREPRIPELEAVLAVLQASPSQRARLLSRIEAPRALRHLNQSPAHRLGPLPNAGDLLRALRYRKKWTQAEVAQRVGVNDSSVARWERGERLPSNEQMQSLCFALEAQEAEIVALTTGGFTEAPLHPAQSWEEARQSLRDRTNLIAHFSEGLQDLNYLVLEREAWEWATRQEAARVELAHVYAYHAMSAHLKQWWQEVKLIGQRAKPLFSPSASPEDFARFSLAQAAATVYGGARTAPQRGIHLLLPLLNYTMQPEYAAWVLSDVATYVTLAGGAERGLELAKQALEAAVASPNPIEPLLRRRDYGQLLIEAHQPKIALDILPAPLPLLYPKERATIMLLNAEAHLAIGSLSEAHDWLQKAQQLVETDPLPDLHSKIQELTQQF